MRTSIRKYSRGRVLTPKTLVVVIQGRYGASVRPFLFTSIVNKSPVKKVTTVQAIIV